MDAHQKRFAQKSLGTYEVIEYSWASARGFKGIRPQRQPTVHKFEPKSRSMVFWSTFLLRLFWFCFWHFSGAGLALSP